ncbi:YfiR family protein [Zoogloea sp.]|uniref:YfiR family protein n=1 Tax=Zoogloea sp. TaxID=49181 RepID=UPI0035B272B4
MATPAPTAAPRRRARWLAIGVALALAGPAARAAPEIAEENALKAAFIYNFAKFSEWPDEHWNRSPRLRVCVTGGDSDLIQAVAALETKPPVRGKPLEVRLLARVDEGRECHILVIAGRSGAQPLLQPIGSAPVLTVGEADGFAGAGGIIGLYMDGDRLRFEANPDAAQRAGLRLSSQILRLARLVRDGKGGR